MKIALAGNPNSGKTTMYNALTGRNERVGNWAGVTVEKKESRIRKEFHDGDREILIVDLPGAYSMSPFSSEESIARDYILKENPDVLINIVDATNLSRSLFFTTQLTELDIPMVIALNKSDVNEKKETKIDRHLLAEKLGCPVVETVSVATSKNGLDDLVAGAVSVMGTKQMPAYIGENVDVADKDAAENADRKRFEFVNDIVGSVESRKVQAKDRTVQDKLDDILTDPWFGIPVFAIIMFLVFYISQTTLGTWISEWLVGMIETFQAWVAGNVSGAAPFLQSLLVDGVIGGVGAVVGFLPLVMVMYFLIALLEDCGYMARATVVLDPIFKKVGLSGKSVIPMVIGTGCAIPGIMAARTIRNERERRATAMLTPFMPCGAKLPVIALFTGAFFSDAPWIGTCMYFVGILLILFGAVLINLITGYQDKKSYFVIELPEYKVPELGRAARSMLSRGKAYIVKAGTLILVCNTVVQLMQTFNWQLQLVEEGMESTSILATVAAPVSVLLVPIVGVAAWQLAAAAVTGFIAKENVVGTLAVCYAMTSFIDTEELALIGNGNEVAAIMGITKVAALAYLVFNLFTPPCFAALGAMNAEMQSRKWFWGGVALQMATGYGLAFFVYQIGTMIVERKIDMADMIVITVLVILVTAAVMYIVKEKKKGTKCIGCPSAASCAGKCDSKRN